MTTEAWWYTMKIHGRSSAIGYLAGARDVVGSTEHESFVFFGGPEIVDAAEEQPPEVKFICNPHEEADEHRQLHFAGVDTQYFNISVIPHTAGDQLFEVNSLSAFINGYGYELPENARLKRLVDCTFQMVKAIDLPAGGNYEQTFDIFMGPKEPELLSQYGVDEVETYGWFAMFSKPLLWVLHSFYFLTGKFSYGLAIILLTVLVRSCMIPFSRKAALSAQMMQHLQPQMMEIKKKYPDDLQRQSQAQRELFSRHNYSPLAGCLPMFIQLPVFIGLYRGLSVDVALRDKPLIPGLSWCSDLSAPDQLFYWKDWMPSMLGDETGWLGPFFNLLPIATMILFMAQQKLFMPKAVDEQQQMMQKMMSFMMPVMGLMFFKVPSGLCLYIITSSLWGIIEKLALPKPVLDTSKFDSDTKPTLAFGGAPKGFDDAAIKVEAQRKRDEKKKADAERKKRLRDRK
jgi:YidC/Oxa1 family membrane protein insertase